VQHEIPLLRARPAIRRKGRPVSIPISFVSSLFSFALADKLPLTPSLEPNRGTNSFSWIDNRSVELWKTSSWQQYSTYSVHVQ
jgi:hypothetical protein